MNFEITIWDLFVISYAGLKSGENAREARKAGVKVVTRLDINFILGQNLVYNLVQCMHPDLTDTSLKDVLEHLSSYLLYADPPKCVFAAEEPFKSLLRDIGYEVPDKMNTGLTEAMLLSGMAAT